MKIKSLLKYLPYVLIGFALMELSFYVKSKYNNFPIERVKVVATYQHLSHAKLQEIIEPSVKTNFFGLKVSRLKRELLGLPWVHSVEIRRVWPNTVIITIHEETAFANWENISLVNENGELFTPPKETFPSGLPIFFGTEDRVQEIWQNYSKLNAILLPLKYKIAEIDLDEQLSWKISLNNGMNIFLGNNNVVEKLQDFAKVYDDVKAVNLASGAKSVDLRYKNGFAVKWD
jgi:cell division protein FtsQ